MASLACTDWWGPHEFGVTCELRGCQRRGHRGAGDNRARGQQIKTQLPPSAMLQGWGWSRLQRWATHQAERGSEPACSLPARAAAAARSAVHCSASPPEPKHRSYLKITTEILSGNELPQTLQRLVQFAPSWEWGRRGNAAGQQRCTRTAPWCSSLPGWTTSAAALPPPHSARSAADNTPEQSTENNFRHVKQGLKNN